MWSEFRISIIITALGLLLPLHSSPSITSRPGSSRLLTSLAASPTEPGLRRDGEEWSESWTERKERQTRNRPLQTTHGTVHFGFRPSSAPSAHYVPSGHQGWLKPSWTIPFVRWRLRAAKVNGMRRGWTEWMTRGYGPPYCFRSLHGSCLSSPFSHVIPLASLRSCSVPFRSERGEGWKTEPSDENGKGTGMNETNRSAPSVLSLRLVTFPGCFHVVYSPPSLVSCRFLPSVSHSVRITPLRFAPLTTLLPEGTDEPVRRWYDGSECKVRGSGAVHVSLRSSHLRPFGPLFVSRSAPRAAPLPPAARSERNEVSEWREWTEDRRYGPLTLLSSRTSPASSGRLSLRLRLSVVPPSRCAGDDEKRGKEWTKMLNSLVIYLYLLFSSFYIYWYSFCYLHVLIIISSHIFYCSFLIFSMSFITSSSNKYRILIFFQLHFIFLIFAIIFYLHITSFIIWIPYLVNIIMIYFLVYKILLLSSLQLLTINFLCFSIL